MTATTVNVLATIFLIGITFGLFGWRGLVVWCAIGTMILFRKIVVTIILWPITIMHHITIWNNSRKIIR